MRLSILIVGALALSSAALASPVAVAGSVTGAGKVTLDGRGDPQFEGDRIDIRAVARTTARGAFRVVHHHGAVAMHLRARVDCLRVKHGRATLSGPVVKSRWSGPRDQWGDPFPSGVRMTLWIRDRGNHDGLGFGFGKVDEKQPCKGQVLPYEEMLPVQPGDFRVRSRSR